MPDVPIAPPATGPLEGWAAVGFVSSRRNPRLLAPSQSGLVRFPGQGVGRVRNRHAISVRRCTQGDVKARQLLTPVADPSTEELGFAGEPSRGQEGVGSGSPQRAARTAHGSELWSEQIVRTLGLEPTVRPRGRPLKTAT